ALRRGFGASVGAGGVSTAAARRSSAPEAVTGVASASVRRRSSRLPSVLPRPATSIGTSSIDVGREARILAMNRAVCGAGEDAFLISDRTFAGGVEPPATALDTNLSRLDRDRIITQGNAHTCDQFPEASVIYSRETCICRMRAMRDTGCGEHPMLPSRNGAGMLSRGRRARAGDARAWVEEPGRAATARQGGSEA